MIRQYVSVGHVSQAFIGAIALDDATTSQARVERACCDRCNLARCDWSRIATFAKPPSLWRVEFMARACLQ